MTGTRSTSAARALPDALAAARTVVVICAHPDDESCGLGALIALTVSLGKHVSLATFTRGEAGLPPGWAHGRDRLARLRTGELSRAAEILGIHRRVTLDYPDGGLTAIGTETLAEECRWLVRRWRPDVVLAYDPQGVTCHPDHAAVGLAILEAVDGAPSQPAVLFWSIPHWVAAAMSGTLGEEYVGRPETELITVDVGDFRERQCWAVAAHATQACDLSPQFSLRLKLCGRFEHLTFPSLWRQGPVPPPESLDEREPAPRACA